MTGMSRSVVCPSTWWPTLSGRRRCRWRTLGRTTANGDRGYAVLDGRLHVAVITQRGDAIHVISFRKANRKEVKRYEQEKGQ